MALSEKQEAYLRECEEFFDEMDKDKNGTLKFSEMEEYYGSKFEGKERVTMYAIKAFLRKRDTNKDGLVPKAEYMDGLREYVIEHPECDH